MDNRAGNSKPNNETDGGMDESMKDSLLRYRREHFRVEVKPTINPEFDGQMTLSVTLNGYQWQTIGLLHDEAEKVVSALTSRLSQSDVCNAVKTSNQNER